MFSIGGGSIRIENEASDEDKEVYPQHNFSEIVSLCNQEKISIVQLIYILEGYQLRDYLKTVWTAMRSAVERGLKAKGILPGGLKLTRKAKYLYEKRCYNESADVAMNRVIAAYAYAVSEENAAEIAMEHNLGLTCDPVNGLVQIPCIERNAVAAMRALSSVNLSRFLYATRKISFDDVVATMYRTGLDLNEKYRETAHGGLAQIYKEHAMESAK